MPEEIVILTVVTISVICGTIFLSIIASMFFRYLREKAGIQKGNSSSLTAGELEEMLRMVVEEANAPILSRIEQLEDRFSSEKASGTEPVGETHRLLPHERDAVLEELDGSRDLAAVSKTKSPTT